MTTPAGVPRPAVVSPRPHRGEIWWADVPGDRVRPILVLTRERFIDHLHSVLVAPLTTRVRGIPTEVEFSIGDGLPARCAANFDAIFTLSRERLREPISALTAAKLDEVCLAYRFAAGC